MRVQTLFLDAGGVLVHPNWERVAAVLRSHGIAADGALLAAQQPFVQRELDRPQPVRESNDVSRGAFLFHRVLERAGIGRSPGTDAAILELQAYHDAENIWEEVPVEVPDVLAGLRRRGLRLVVVSNANGTLERMFERKGLRGFFDLVLDSAVVGVEKPDPRIFEIALERSGAEPETTIHVGDLYEVDVVGARAAGVGAVLVDVAGLYDEVDCPRVRSLVELPELLEDASLEVRR